VNTAGDAPLIRVQGLTLHFDGGRIKALDGVDLEVQEGEFLAVTGPSGCGKSSLLSLIGLLDSPTSGTIELAGQPYAAVRDESLFRRRHIGFVFQSFHLLPTLTALQNVAVPTVGAGGSAAGHLERARSLLTQLGLGRSLNQFPAQLSGGERQRVAIARALINDPKLILADEPTGALDSTNAHQVLELLAGIRRDRGLTVVMVTHDASVSSLADRVIHMRDGRVERTTLAAA
jgi:ABC-type lipoprotein export system ATPase subunit